MSRDTLILCVFSLLATASVLSSYQWMAQNAPLDSRQAVYQAQKLLEKRKQNPQHLKLVNVSPPDSRRNAWLLSFQKKPGSLIRVLVTDDGKTRLI